MITLKIIKQLFVKLYIVLYALWFNIFIIKTQSPDASNKLIISSI